MKRHSITVLFLLCLTVSAFAQEERKVAVFDPAGSVEKALLEIVREEISSVVVNTTGYTVLERQLINKVLEENRFQESGLVNDEQVSDIGKRMGADYVFVTTISLLGENYYISCKMIEVATARIDKQFTGTSTDGINDIPQTTQYIVRRLFGENAQQPVANIQRQQTDRPVQTTTTQRDVPVRQPEDNYTIQSEQPSVASVVRQPGTPANNRESSDYGRLVAHKSNVYSFGNALSRDEVRNIMYDTDALNYYNQGMKLHTAGNALKAIGWIMLGVGAIIEISNVASYYDEYDEIDGYQVGKGAVVGIVGFCVIVIPGSILKGAAKQNVSKAVDIYNRGMSVNTQPPSLFEVDFGITASGGVGFVIRF